MTQSSERLNILQRMHEVMKVVTYIQKEKKQGMRYSIVSHDVVTAKLRPALINAGIVYWPINFEFKQTGNRTECVGTVRFASIDDPTDCIDVATAGHGIDEQDKGPGKAMSYAVKYAQLKAFALETGDDPDLDQNVEVDDPDDAHMVNIKEFNAKVQEAKTTEQLVESTKTLTVYMRDAEAKWPGKVAAARAAYSAKLAQLKKGA